MTLTTPPSLAVNSFVPNRSRLSNQELGELGERMAGRYLEMRGFKILATNWRHKFGEIDLIVRDRNAIVAIEVKTRSSLDFGHPLEAITKSKIGRLRALLALWMGEQNISSASMRIDAIGIVVGGGSKTSIDYRQGIA